METKAYRKHLQAKLITEFQKSFYQKTGLRASVMIEKIDAQTGGIPYLDLDELINHMNLFISPMQVPARTTLKTQNRSAQLVALRSVYYHLARSMGYTLKVIGKKIERDHTTVIKGLKTAKFMMDTQDDLFMSLYNSVTNHLRQFYAYEPEQALSDPDQAPVDTEPVVPALLP